MLFSKEELERLRFEADITDEQIPSEYEELRQLYIFAKWDEKERKKEVNELKRENAVLKVTLNKQIGDMDIYKYRSVVEKLAEAKAKAEVYEKLYEELLKETLK